MFRVKVLNGDERLRELYATEESVKIKKLQETQPEAKEKTDSGCDLYCAEDVVVAPFGTALVRFGVACAASDDTAYWLFPRSSFGKKTTLLLANSIGLIDKDYRGELMAYVRNISHEEFKLYRYDAWFQLARADLKPVRYEVVDALDETGRGARGFGSTYQSTRTTTKPMSIKEAFDKALH